MIHRAVANLAEARKWATSTGEMRHSPEYGRAVIASAVVFLQADAGGVRRRPPPGEAAPGGGGPDAARAPIKFPFVVFCLRSTESTVYGLRLRVRMCAEATRCRFEL
ncbi:hypothetical protein EVAR_88786_1 [Eumeta japonica]|uniref:Uncharacterized protein n=1 Tax=Eumeta variegata TaxID=151549 RepID=A0A4C1XTX4_EUMVA|nr:hypothetical protein EVAR_88786_1 [Eumeta japonica]